jgi:hypothetical protein
VHTPANVLGISILKAKVSQADVFDHMEYILSSMDMFGSTTENLISFTFNVGTYYPSSSVLGAD